MRARHWRPEGARIGSVSGRARNCVRLALFVFLVAPAAPLHAQQPTAQEIVESQRRLEQLRQQRSQLAEEMTRIRARVTDLSQELVNVERQVNSSAAALREIDFQLEQWEEEIASNSIELEATRLQLAERRAVLNRRLRSIYKRGPTQTLQVLLAAKNFSDLINRYRYLDLAARADRRLMEEVKELESLLLARERALRANMLELESARVARQQEHEALAELQDQQQVVLREVTSEEATTAERIAEIERDEAALTTMVAGIEAQRVGAGTSPVAGGGGGGGPTVAFPGRRRELDWPLDGPLLYRFGAVGGSTTGGGARSGIGIGGPRGAPVRAVAAGTVALAGPFEGYGPTVIISHGGGYYTLYLYLRDVTVRTGAIVTLGQTIGTVGGERTEESSYLEFQVHGPGGEIADPLSWLRPQ